MINQIYQLTKPKFINIKYQEEEIVCYKIYIMPHVTKKSLDNFIKDLENTF